MGRWETGSLLFAVAEVTMSIEFQDALIYINNPGKYVWELSVVVLDKENNII